MRYFPSALLLLFLLATGVHAQVSFYLIDAGKNSEIRALTNGETIQESAFSIEARVKGGAASVVFELEGPSSFRQVESEAPFAAGGDSDGNFQALGLKAGDYTLKATPFSKPGGKGEAGEAATLRFKLAKDTKTGKPAAKGGTTEVTEEFPVGELKEVKLKNAKLTGDLKQFHPLTLTLEGPKTSEKADPNPFRDYRLEVQFVHELEGIQVVVPGHYAADGNAAESSAEDGYLWRVHFVPERAGPWRYWVWFREGKNAAIADVEIGVNDFGEPAGKFEVAKSDERPGFLRHPEGERYLRFSGSGEWFLKGGADSPENFLGYADFDGTFDTGGKGAKFLHRYEPHVRDWKEGDPTWQGGKGKGIVGALNYLASKGMNSVYFIPYNLDGGDGQDTWPWAGPDVRDRFDVSKLDQWEIVFSHMDRLGLSMHVILQETENDQALDGGALGDERRLYYRELISRFAHHFGVIWNHGEENTNTTAQVKAFSDYIRAVDPYDHPVVIHTYPNKQHEVYEPLLGFENLDGPSLQMGGANKLTHKRTLEWIRRSREAGNAWFVCHDETGPANRGADPDDREDNNHAQLRPEVLWGNLMAGGAGVEWYFGYQNPHNDLNCENWRSRDRLWDQTRHALTFFQDHLPFTKMESADELLVKGGELDHALAKAGEVYAVFLSAGGEVGLDLSEAKGNFSVAWYDPRNGGELQTGGVKSIEGGDIRELGNPPGDHGADWVVLISRQ